MSDVLAFDELSLLARRRAECRGGNAIDVAKRTCRSLMEQDDGIGGEDLSVASDSFEAHGEILTSVVGTERVEGEAPVDPREERAISPQGEPVVELR